ncbi:MAG: cation:proton antiporter, partial [Candidatus Diapherotrites archaeon]|nr:cation:proton antiporter [Candidatus Diapherotrites archaeon]
MLLIIPAESTLIVLLAVLTLGLIIPELLKKFRLPFITLIILAGAVFGPNLLGYVQVDAVVSFFGFLGMAFLMLMAGLETDMSVINKSKLKIIVMAVLNGFIPFLVGFGIMLFFGYPIETAVLIGIVFISSSVALIVPSLKEAKALSRNTIQLILAAVMVADVISLIALGVIFQSNSPITILPLWIYFPLLIVSIGILFKIVPKVSDFIMQKELTGYKNYEEKLRFVVIMLIGILLYFSLLGVHPILAAFLAGLSLSKVVMKEKTKIVHTKLHTLGYGMFVPVFFFVVGMELDLGVLWNVNSMSLILPVLIVGSILAKLGSGYFAGKIVGLSK